jgi:hypothetical protein
VAFLQEMADQNDGGLITLRCIKNRFGAAYSVTIRPNFEEGTFDVADSPQFTKRTADTDRMLQIIQETPGLTQHAWWKNSGMMKARFVALVKENNGVLWREEKSGNSLRYFPSVLKTQNNAENNRTGQGTGNCSSVLSPLGENREQVPLDPSNCSENNGTAQPEKPNGKSLSQCKSCQSFAVYLEKDGRLTCQTCEVSQ